jgi:Transposase IS4
VYVDRFYTSVDLLKTLDRMQLLITGTVMRNRIPKELTIPKTSREFKGMERGEWKFHQYTYIDDNNMYRFSMLEGSRHSLLSQQRDGYRSTNKVP